MSRFFIERPIFAGVVAIIITLLGLVSFFVLPVTQYPDITPPVVRVSASFPGATPQDIADTVAQPIEVEVNGVDNMVYMESSSTSDGTYTLDVTFEPGSDVDMSTVLVQNRVGTAMSSLPEEVTRNGVKTEKRTSALIAIISTFSETHDDTFLSNYFTLNLKDEILRVHGVGSVNVFPEKDYGMRVWLDPEALRVRDITAIDVVDAIRAQNVQVAAGRIGEEPAPRGTAFDLGVTVQGRLADEEEFANIIVAQRDGGVVRVRDVARIELGGKNYTASSVRDGVTNATAFIYQAPGSNAIEVAEAIREIIERERPNFPEGVDVQIDFDVSGFINAAIGEVYHTLGEAFLLVGLVVFIFLGSWRTTIIPIIAIPVSLIGTFFVMALLGFSLNLVTLLGLVLAIGIVVDDAIVVVENVERLMATRHLSPKDATIEAMKEVTGPIVATTFVLMAVFIPVSAMPGISGSIYQQFALTIAVSTLFSSINALTLSPALCGVLLKPHDPNKKPSKFNAVFNKTFDAITERFGALVSVTLRKVMITVVLVVALLGLAGERLAHTPTGFVPNEDQGILLAETVLPAGASLQRTEEVTQGLAEALEDVEGIAHITAIAGYGMVTSNGSNNGLLVLSLEPWDDRVDSGRDIHTIQDEVNALLRSKQEAAAYSFELPPIPGLGTGAGFDLRIQDARGYGPDVLEQVAEGVVEAANGQSRIAGVNSTFRAASPQLRLDIDRDQAIRRGVAMGDVFRTLSATLGSTYVNDFTLFGRSFQVRVQARPEARVNTHDLMNFSVRNIDGEMVPLGAFTRTEDTVFPNRVQRFNMYPNAQLTGQGAPGVSTGDAINLMEELTDQELPEGMRYGWAAVSYFEKATGGGAGAIFGLAILMVFLVLAAQYESWSLPIAVILTIPMALLGAMVAVNLRGMDNNIFVQAGLVLLVGLAAKNAILIVEFARAKMDEGMTPKEAALESAKLRFRPIVMTSLAFILGVVPLVIGTGAGAVSRQAVGTTVFGGMLFVTLVGVITAPVLFMIVMNISEKFSKKKSS
ncbi:MAG: hydrophobe/amphiphile efflux-1 family RND transporter [Deltaproteobacteria bacterium]|nr:MAG: hydrophobe/amphiphile efflux-1 family RND transporter [Deltaproteobacteria bacterium]